MTEFSVETVMQREFLTLRPDMPIRAAVALLVERDAPAAPVTDENGRLAGILTQKDCFRPVLQAAYYQEWRGVVADHMSTNVLTVVPDEDLTHAAELFLQHPHRQFPVVDGEKLVGLLCRTDVLARLSGLK